VIQPPPTLPGMIALTMAPTIRPKMIHEMKPIVPPYVDLAVVQMRNAFIAFQI
jgi:hypothetical protein